jgi:hypothetical protein
MSNGSFGVENELLATREEMFPACGFCVQKPLSSWDFRQAGNKPNKNEQTTGPNSHGRT